jgi:hypothetical protein
MGELITLDREATKPKFTYYNYDKLYSFNGAYNFVCGGRGLGKTFGAKEKALKKAIKRGEMFIYLRRFKTELPMAKATFFEDIAPLFPDYDFRSNGPLAEMSPITERDKKKRKWQTIGYFFALTEAQKLKSVALKKVTLIIFDEFIIEKGATHYLPQEEIIFNNLYSTVDRYGDKTKVLFLANAVSIMNPYFIAWNIRPPEDGEFVISHDGFIVAHFPKAEQFTNEVKQTRFGRFIDGTEYAEYAVANQFSDNDDSLIEVKGYKARYQFTLECHNGTFSIWYDMINQRYYAQASRPKDELIFTLVMERMNTEKTLMTFADRPLGELRAAYRSGKMLFDEPSTRNAFYEVFKK